MADLMISYARADAGPFARQLAVALKQSWDTWLDISSIEGGADWLRSIQEAIAGCRVFLAVRSLGGSNSLWVRSERLFALNKRKPIIPILTQPCRTEDLELISYQTIDFQGDFDQALRRLNMQIEHCLRGTLPVSDRRTLEERYLGRLLLDHAVWQELYTPMAGVAQLRAEPGLGQPARVVTLPAGIDPHFRQYVQERLEKQGKRSARQQREYADILPAVEEIRQLVVLGDPGSGKTTTLWRIAADAANQARTDPARPLPLLARLGEWRPDQTLEEHLLAQLGDLGRYYPELLHEKRLGLLLDGLNELPAENRAAHIAQVKALMQRCHQAGLVAVVTCRELDYTGELDLGLTHRLVIAPLDPLRIRQFVRAYLKEPPNAPDQLFWQLAGDTARASWQELQAWSIDERTFWMAETAPDRPDSWQFLASFEAWLRERDHPRSMLTLARNPYMLFMMTQIFTLEMRIPTNRGLLFGWFVDFLLTKRERLTTAPAEELQRCLAELAYAMQTQGDGTSLPRSAVIAQLHSERRLYLAQSANILSGTEEVRFTHQLLQEFFAAHKLDRLFREGIPATQFWPVEHWWEPQGWEETTVLLAGLYSDDLTPILHWLRDANPEWAARCVLESGAHTPAKEMECLRALWLPRLVGPRQDPQPEARAAVGRALGLLILDDRPGVGLRADGLPDIAWCEVPAGTFAMGGDPDVEGTPWAGSCIDITDRYWIARYPVTYAQYTPFLTADGYRRRDFWTEAGWRWKGARTAPSYWNQPRWHISNHPVVGITWYEALAYTRWLNDRAQRHAGVLPVPAAVLRLPTEAEWEKSARYPDGRKFPWGAAYVSGQANVNEPWGARGEGPFNLQRTTAVGIYPRGASPVGAHDLCGNVFDWCLSAACTVYTFPENLDVEGDVRRVARGGAWLRSVDAARAAYREIVSPDAVYDDQGFRLCAVIPSS